VARKLLCRKRGPNMRFSGSERTAGSTAGPKQSKKASHAGRTLWFKGLSCSRRHKSFEGCGGLTLAGCQTPPKPLYHPPSSAGQGREKITKGSWVEVRTGRHHSSITVTGKTDWTWEKLI